MSKSARTNLIMMVVFVAVATVLSVTKYTQGETGDAILWLIVAAIAFVQGARRHLQM